MDGHAVKTRTLKPQDVLLLLKVFVTPVGTWTTRLLASELFMSPAPDDIKDFVAECFGVFLHDEDFLDALSSHLYPDDASQGRAALIKERMFDISQS